MHLSTYSGTALGERIRAERERLGFTQEAFAALASSAKRSQIGWEQDRTKPDAGVLEAWAAAGADVLYIVTGKRATKIDMDLLGMTEAAIKLAYEKLRGEVPARQVTLNAMSKVYNSTVGKLGPESDVPSMVREEAASYVAVLDDPDNPGLLDQALFRKPTETSTPSVKVKASGGSLAAGGNVTIGSKRK